MIVVDNNENSTMKSEDAEAQSYQKGLKGQGWTFSRGIAFLVDMMAGTLSRENVGRVLLIL